MLFMRNFFHIFNGNRYIVEHLGFLFSTSVPQCWTALSHNLTTFSHLFFKISPFPLPVSNISNRASPSLILQSNLSRTFALLWLSANYSIFPKPLNSFLKSRFTQYFLDWTLRNEINLIAWSRVNLSGTDKKLRQGLKTVKFVLNLCSTSSFSWESRSDQTVVQG